MINNKIILLISVLLLSNTLSVFAKKKIYIDENTGASGSLNPTIPEPMIFDLVRPLGAKKGELEINTLVEARPNRSSEGIRWSPEIEWVIFNGLALEFELPMREIEIDDFKVAMQKTFGRDREKKFIHGWQTIGKYNHHSNSFNLTNLYLCGYRFNSKWSTLLMNGIKNDHIGRSFDISPIANASLFRHIGPNIKLGLETNYAFHQVNLKERYNSFLIIPQAHVELGKNYSIQVGIGLERYDSSQYAGVLAMRLIKEF